MRAKGDGALGDLAQLRQRHHLEAAGVGQHRAVPVGEPLQAAELRDAFGPGPQHQVIGVAQHDVGAGLADLAPMHAFHRPERADRHEGRRPHRAMGCRQRAEPRGAVGGDKLERVRNGHRST